MQSHFWSNSKLYLTDKVISVLVNFYFLEVIFNIILGESITIHHRCISLESNLGRKVTGSKSPGRGVFKGGPLGHAPPPFGAL